VRLSDWKSSPIKKRRLWWTEPGFFWIVGVLYTGSGIVGILLISVRFPIAGQILGIFWVFMLPVIILLYKRTQSDQYYTDESVVQRTKRDLLAHRSARKAEFLKNEIEILEKGEKTPVLDIWRLDPELQKRHPFFSCIEVVSIDPASRELHIRVQVENVPETRSSKDSANNPFLTNVREFLSVLSNDSYLANLKKFFAAMVLEIYSLRENERGMDVPFAVFSMNVNAQNLWKLAVVQTTLPNIAVLGEVRFNDGQEIKPHRSIEGPNLSSK